LGKGTGGNESARGAMKGKRVKKNVNRGGSQKGCRQEQRNCHSSKEEHGKTGLRSKKEGIEGVLKESVLGNIRWGKWGD